MHEALPAKLVELRVDSELPQPNSPNKLAISEPLKNLAMFDSAAKPLNQKVSPEKDNQEKSGNDKFKA